MTLLASCSLADSEDYAFRSLDWLFFPPWFPFIAGSVFMSEMFKMLAGSRELESLLV